MLSRRRGLALLRALLRRHAMVRRSPRARRRRHGEAAVILELMTRAHGRHLGLVHGGRSKRLAPVLQPGNSVEAVWRARLDEHLGIFTIEGQTMLSSRLIASPLALYGIAAMASLLRSFPSATRIRGSTPPPSASPTISTTPARRRRCSCASSSRSRRARLRPRSLDLRRDRRARRPRLRVAEERARGQRRRRRALYEASVRAAGLPAPRDRRRAKPGRDQGRLRLHRVLPAHPSLRGAGAAGPGRALALRRAVHKKRSFTGRLALVLDSFRQLRRGDLRTTRSRSWASRLTRPPARASRRST